jgi:hypothetical protein
MQFRSEHFPKQARKIFHPSRQPSQDCAARDDKLRQDFPHPICFTTAQSTRIAHHMNVTMTATNNATDWRSCVLACIYLTRQYFTTRLNLFFFCFMLPYL